MLALVLWMNALELIDAAFFFLGRIWYYWWCSISRQWNQPGAESIWCLFMEMSLSMAWGDHIPCFVLSAISMKGFMRSSVYTWNGVLLAVVICNELNHDRNGMEWLKMDDKLVFWIDMLCQGCNSCFYFSSQLLVGSFFLLCIVMATCLSCGLHFALSPLSPFSLPRCTRLSSLYQ